MSETRSTGPRPAGLFERLQRRRLPGADWLSDALLAYPVIHVHVVPTGASNEVIIEAIFNGDDGSARFMMTHRVAGPSAPTEMPNATLTVEKDGQAFQVYRSLGGDRGRGIARRLCRHELSREGRPTPVSVDQRLTTSVACLVLRDEAVDAIASQGAFVYVGGEDRH